MITVVSEYERKIGENIRLLRQKNHLSQDELAAKMQVKGCDITRSTVAKIEVGQRHLYADEIRNLKKIFKVSYEDLLEPHFDSGHTHKNKRA